MKQNNEKNNQIDKMMESYYGYVGYCHTENIIKELDKKKDDINQIEIPSSMNDRFNEFSKKYNRKNNMKKITKHTQKIGKRRAVYIVIILCIGTVITCSVEALRIKILNFFIETYKEYTSVEVTEEEKNIIPSSWSNYYYPEYLPKNFELDYVEVLNDIKIIYFVYDDRFISMRQSPNGTNYQIDTEEAKTKKITINGKKGILVEKGERTTIIWHNDEYSFNFSSNIKSQELIKVVESLEKK